MQSSYPQTIDVSVEPTEPIVVAESQSVDFRLAINQSLGADAFLLVGSLLMGILCSGAVSVMDVNSELTPPWLRPLPWFVFIACVAPALWNLLLDTLSAASRPARLPFAYSQTQAKAIYAKRLHLALAAIYFAFMLVAFCWSVPSMLMFSKLFVAAVFALALYALGQSIPSRRQSFVVTGSLFLVVLIAAQLFVIAAL